MHGHAIAEENRPASVGIIPWHVAEVEALPGFRLRVRFDDDTAGTVDMSAMVRGPRAGVFAVLADPSQFAKVKIDGGAVTWPDVLDAWPWSLDLAPDAMHDEIAANGEWVLG